LAAELSGRSTFYSALFWLMRPNNRPVGNTADPIPSLYKIKKQRRKKHFSSSSNTFFCTIAWLHVPFV
jgi:hypothetical protein